MLIVQYRDMKIIENHRNCYGIRANQAHMAYQNSAPMMTQQPHFPMQAPQQPTAQFGDHNALNALSPTDLGTALSMMQLNHPDPNWNMDTGASSHITAERGPEDGYFPFSPQ
ncbi:hypothetical protein HanXRQr2_Chr15g0682351 [Helianthus annuus]|uniref:Uncharacterized protein n=1 Tax=Helianthus annuus TaxID=4232 RepID=A0A251S7D1_HELAN|nr:hypothetical protein HanXRQr2_Chr15g0682351 [Helianthus annuus]KAJ0830339.1 hypothetical protein HanPSC8_Chr15g0654291 [Helianthus annuus]